jgi:glutathione S-transferase
MTKPRLTYFDAPASRGEECRLALHLAGVDFEDVRVKGTDWPQLKNQTPFGGMPILELPGKPPLGQSNAILAYIGRSYGLHPTDLFEAAQHEAMMAHVEDLRWNMTPTLRLQDPEKKSTREALAANYLPQWATRAERQIRQAPFFGGDKIHVVDLKLHMAVRWFNGGRVDYIPATIFDDFPKLNRIHDAVRDHPGIKEWNAKQAR